MKQPAQPSTSKFFQENELTGQSGMIALEFLLLMPVLLTLFLIILQLGLLMQARFVVNYAAFQATRSAIVTIPATITSERTNRTEARNQVELNTSESPKMRILHRAAALSLTSISTSGSLTDLSPGQLIQLEKVALLFSASINGKNVSQQLLPRAAYAYDQENTKVELIPETSSQGTGQYGEHDPITVRVTFRYPLVIPFANRMFGTKRSSLAGGWYVALTDQYTLYLNGEPLFPPDQQPANLQPEVDRY